MTSNVSEELFECPQLVEVMGHGGAVIAKNVVVSVEGLTTMLEEVKQDDRVILISLSPVELVEDEPPCREGSIH